MGSTATANSLTETGAITLEEAWLTCADLYERLSRERRRPRLEEIHEELLFCLLGGYGVSYELNLSAADIVGRLAPFTARRDEDELQAELEALLNRPAFEPRCANGSLRRYRFPTRKAALIIAARRWVERQPPLDRLLLSLRDERQRRAYMCSCPGIGPKTASWLLRNLGLARNLAVLDVHVVRALADAGRLTARPVLPRDYEVVEDAFLSWCGELDADPGAFDVFVWHWQRGAFAV